MKGENMVTHLRKTFSALLVFLLVLTSLSVPGLQIAPPVTNPVEGSLQTMPDGLMGAFLEASSRPFEFGLDGYRAHSGGLDFILNTRGLQTRGENLDWFLSLSGIGRGMQTVPLSDAVIVQTGGRLEYRRGDLVEWYRDTAVGLEQGFTISQAPGGQGLLILKLAFSSNLSSDLYTELTAKLDANGCGISFFTPQGQVLHYNNLLAWDANRVQLQASLAYTPGQITLRVDDRAAAYPITIDPLIYNEQKVVAPGEAGDLVGISVAVEGDVALVGAYQDDVGANADQGSVYAFEFNGSIWTMQDRITAAGGEAGDNFGCSVALSGSFALIGAYLNDVDGKVDQGSAYIFSHSHPTWTQQAFLVESVGARNDNFGRSVAISGTTALVGAPYDWVGSNRAQGSAYVFIISGISWIQQARLIASDGAADDTFGMSVALDGNIAVVGSPRDHVGTNSDQGSAYVFIRSGTTWPQEAQMVASDGLANDNFGNAVALDGGTALVGASADTVGTNNAQGSAYIFSRKGTSWTQKTQLTAADGAVNDHFGVSVALSGGTAVVGAYGDQVGTNLNQGSAYVFTGSEASWTQQAQISTSDGAAEDRFGIAVAISGDTALVGAYQDDIGANSNQGSAFLFTRSGTDWTQGSQLTGSDGEDLDKFGYSVALSGDTALVGAYQDTTGEYTNQGSVYVFTRVGTSWSFQQKLVPLEGTAEAYFGYSIALLGDTALIGAYMDSHVMFTNQGSAYVFTRSSTVWTQQARLTSADGAEGDAFGFSVALLGDIALVGAIGDDIYSNSNQGSAYIFTRNGSTWTQQAKLTDLEGEAEDCFGNSVALSGDTALIGARCDDAGFHADQGSAYVFTGSGATWTLQGQLTASDGAAYDNFGCDVALEQDTALVGAWNHEVGTNDGQGSAYVFTRTGTTWSEQAQLTALDGDNFDQFGASVALAGDTALVGAASHTVGDNADQGSAYLFLRSGGGWSQQAELTASDGDYLGRFGHSVALTGSRILVGVPADIMGDLEQGSAYFYDLRMNLDIYLPQVQR
jgi:hypothetical protein